MFKMISLLIFWPLTIRILHFLNCMTIFRALYQQPIVESAGYGHMINVCQHNGMTCFIYLLSVP